MKTTDIILLSIGILTVIFTVTMIWLFIVFGDIPDTLVSMWFTYILGECGTMGLIKVAKNFELKNSAEVEKVKKEIQDTKNKLAEMASHEAGKE